MSFLASGIMVSTSSRIMTVALPCTPLYGGMGSSTQYSIMFLFLGLVSSKDFRDST
jgi:hypothetical protein